MVPLALLVTAMTLAVSLLGELDLLVAEAAAPGGPPGRWWTQWELDLPAIVLLLGLGALYLRGEYLWHLDTGGHRPHRVAAFTIGWVVALLSLVSPVAALSGDLLWVHMIQHLLMVVVAAPLFALGAPQSAIRRAVGSGPRRTVSRAVRRVTLRRRGWAPPTVVLAAIVHIAALWIWHLPALYDLAATNAFVHLLEHAFFLGTAVWFWMAVVAATRRGRRQHALATMTLAAQIATGGVLGALLTFTSRSMYDAYDGGWGLTALEDQEFAGSLMWVPPSFVYAVTAIVLFIRWFDLVEREARRREARSRQARSTSPDPHAEEPASDEQDTEHGPRGRRASR